ncbi:MULTISPECIES: molybdenum cofactor guanylyltransferase [Leeuwenhoekiella]|jgi:molybdenum cofactor guanylyltransferase|uniref:molybdenum cofactor guanylyltransferase n=1 Tax=Leeuwenhoekiella TaxID=283735 RepID=UPI000C39FA62|nr:MULTISPECIES: molybdenum cofactor guanylyltransferase [Leeuwenhoekiella]MAO44517.1 molybdenum cofactor guanylyltransferase [Leeuwenhoekiella sp.]HCW63545.1 molybdenum cofactor guanylyltransferase [Leeuwenhoekiella sp.]|tara:strand:+ start:747 stop:1325 length:579 start_codon:yes stop_codon:yes gene_type:complete
MIDPLKNNIPAYILCGGRSSRMGQDKGLVTLQENEFISHIINTLKNITDSIVLVTKNKEYGRFRLPIIQDIYAEKGPLGGIHAALQHTEESQILVFSCDIPLLKSYVIEELLRFKNSADIVFAKTEKKWHPLIGIYAKCLLPEVEENLKQNKLKLIDFIKEQNYKAVNFIDEAAFTNINTPAILARLEKNLV